MKGVASEHIEWARAQGMTPAAVMRSIGQEPPWRCTWGHAVYAVFWAWKRMGRG